MTLAELLSRVESLGAVIVLSGADVRLRRPPDCEIPEVLRAELRRRNTELLAELDQRRRECLARWTDAVEDVARVWNRHKAETGRVAEIDPELDEAIDQDASAAIKAADLAGTRAACDRLCRAWDEAIDPRRAAIYAAADQMIAESEGRGPPLNESVCAEMGEAGEGSVGWPTRRLAMTRWLREHAPEVAARWPEAPEDASWLDWRQHVGARGASTLDDALRATWIDGVRSNKEQSS